MPDDAERLPPVPHRYPTPSLSDQGWEAVVGELRRSPRERSRRLADQIDRQLQENRRLWAAGTDAGEVARERLRRLARRS